MNRIFLSLFCLTAPDATYAQDAVPSPSSAPATFKSLVPEPRTEAGLMERHTTFNEISKKGEAEIVFLGDSITQGWEGGGKKEWETTWAPLKSANFGVSGDRTEHVLWRLDHGNYDGLHAKLTVLMIGTNNTGHRMDPASETAAGIKGILEKLEAKQPEMKILLLGIFPRGEKADDPKRIRTNEINELIAKFADGKKVFYLDLNSKFLSADGTLSKEIMPDSLHPNAKGYEIWTAAIEPEVKELLSR